MNFFRSHSTDNSFSDNLLETSSDLSSSISLIYTFLTDFGSTDFEIGLASSCLTSLKKLEKTLRTFSTGFFNFSTKLSELFSPPNSNKAKSSKSFY